ncbi:hypothetical protein DMH04_03510 [Kibdelosporangium aridum]|uniref:Trypsin-co-occurring domain-containing protein n=1 Tax=Kibdelosporangium aridum TaxID=2030 RepID=A0A428ZR53_KIBAR|nr:CU044_2847 family protein [Kibdelosporangium aridum]RSM90546.1 hypothetical protein DMH04_03510 [Kibdelosporangium aridum]
MAEIDQEPVLVQVVDVADGREIGWGSNAANKLGDRMDDVRKAIVAGTRAIANGLPDLVVAENWEVGEVSATFGVTLTAEAGVLLSRAGAEATFEVTVTFQRKE